MYELIKTINNNDTNWKEIITLTIHIQTNQLTIKGHIIDEPLNHFTLTPNLTIEQNLQNIHQQINQAMLNRKTNNIGTYTIRIQATHHNKETITYQNQSTIPTAT